MELTLFVIVGAIAVVSAAMMLISENAVYSALFLILNFACIAFFFLMLNAPFLAMVQITVYAGAIMVLFLFVIMLLGAERVIPVSQPRLRWLAPTAILLALLFLVAASIAIINGEIDLTEPRQDVPRVRAIHVLDGVDAIDLYLDDEPVVQGLAFGASTEFDSWDEGRYVARVFQAGANPAEDAPLVEQPVDVDRGEVLSFTAAGRTMAPGPTLVVATQDLTYNKSKDSLWLLAVNGLPDQPALDVVDETAEDNRRVLIDGLAYGTAVEAEVEKGTRTIAAYPDGGEGRLAVLEDQELKPNTAVLMVFAEQRRPDNSFASVLITLQNDANPSFGSPIHVGRLLFSRYVLPFEIVGLLLLVAMIGAIVLTHETLAPRRAMVCRLAVAPVVESVPGEQSK